MCRLVFSYLLLSSTGLLSSLSQDASCNYRACYKTSCSDGDCLNQLLFNSQLEYVCNQTCTSPEIEMCFSNDGNELCKPYLCVVKNFNHFTACILIPEPSGTLQPLSTNNAMAKPTTANNPLIEFPWPSVSTKQSTSSTLITITECLSATHDDQGTDNSTYGRLIIFYCVSMVIMIITLVLVSIWALVTYWKYAKLKSLAGSNKAQS